MLQNSAEAGVIDSLFPSLTGLKVKDTDNSLNESAPPSIPLLLVCLEVSMEAIVVMVSLFHLRV